MPMSGQVRQHHQVTASHLAAKPRSSADGDQDAAVLPRPDEAVRFLRDADELTDLDADFLPVDDDPTVTGYYCISVLNLVLHVIVRFCCCPRG